MDRLLLLWDSSELSVIIPEWLACVEEEEMSDASYQSLSLISIESPVPVRGLLDVSGRDNSLPALPLGR